MIHALRAITAIVIFVSCCHADIPVIDNPREAPVQRTVQYEEIWRAGADDEADYIFGVIQEAETDSEGNIYLLDIQQFIVFKFSPTGEYLGTVSRRGEGPGEIENCFTLVRWDADHLALSKLIPAGLVIVSNDGTPATGVEFSCAKRHETQKFAFINSLQVRDGHIVGQGLVHRMEKGQMAEINFTVSLDRGGNEIHGFGNHEVSKRQDNGFHIDEQELFNPTSTWTLGQEGEVYFAPEWDDWVIEVRRTTGELIRTIRRDFEPHWRTDEEIEEAKLQWTFSGKSLGEVSFDMSKTDPAIRELDFVTGELRARSPGHKRDLPEGIADRFDVLDPAGHLIEERSLAFPFDPDEDLLVYLNDGRVLRVSAWNSASAAAQDSYKVENGEKVARTSDEDVVLEVIVYRPVEM